MTAKSLLLNSAPTSARYPTASIEVILYVMLLIVAFALRAIAIGSTPLSGAEAPQAMAAYHFLSPERALNPGAIDSILVFAGVALSFAIATPTDAAARFLSVVAGLALAMSPALFRHRLGRFGALLFCLILAISPSAVITSRQMTGAGLSMVGLVGLLAALDRWLIIKKRAYAYAAGVALAVTLLADYGALAALVALLGGIAFSRLTDEESYLDNNTTSPIIQAFPWGAALIGFVSAVLLLSTLFSFFPSGLGAAADQLAHFFTGLTTRQPNAPYLGLVLAAYEPFVLIFGLIGAWLASQSSLPGLRFLAGWGIAATIVSLLYAGASPAHSLWSVVPMGALSALALVNLLSPLRRVPAWALRAHGAGTTALLGMIVANLTQQVTAPRACPIGPTGIQVQCNFALVVLAAILLSILWLIVASVWGQRAAWRGGGFGLAAVGLLVSLGLSGAMAFTRPNNPYDLYNGSPTSASAALMVKTAEDASIISDNARRQASLTIIGEPSPVLAWLLRNFDDVTVVPNADANTKTVLVVTQGAQASPVLGANYYGQGFALTKTWSPSSMDYTQFLSWLLFRTADPTAATEERVILWVRSDVGNLAPSQP